MSLPVVRPMELEVQAGQQPHVRMDDVPGMAGMLCGLGLRCAQFICAYNTLSVMANTPALFPMAPHHHQKLSLLMSRRRRGPIHQEEHGSGRTPMVCCLMDLGCGVVGAMAPTYNCIFF